MEAVAARTLLLGLPGPDVDDESLERLTRLGPAGVILFGRNLDTPPRLRDLISRLQGALPPPILIALDQEGGRVSRLAPWIGATAPAADLSPRGPSTAFRFGKLTGDALAALGFNLDFAPVVDLGKPEAGANAIGDRAWGTDPDLVARHAGAFLDGLLEAGVAGCLKHFPGLGGTCVDSHVELPRDTRQAREIEECDVLPYRTLGARAPCVMVGHAHYPAWEPDAPVPATASQRVISDLLRTRLGYRGLVATDDLEMGAVRDLDAGGAFAVRAIRAGCDLLLYCVDIERATVARDRLAREARSDPRFAARLRSAADAVTGTARRWPAHTPDLDAWARAADALRRFAVE